MWLSAVNFAVIKMETHREATYLVFERNIHFQRLYSQHQVVNAMKTVLKFPTYTIPGVDLNLPLGPPYPIILFYLHVTLVYQGIPRIKQHSWTFLPLKFQELLFGLCFAIGLYQVKDFSSYSTRLVNVLSSSQVKFLCDCLLSGGFPVSPWNYQSTPFMSTLSTLETPWQGCQ